MERAEIAGRDLGHDRRIAEAARRHAVRVPRPVERGKKRSRSDRVRVVELGRDARQLLGAQAFDFRCLEGRIAHHVRQQLDRGRKVRRQREHRHRRPVERCGGLDVRAQALVLLGDLDAVPRRRAFGHQAQHQRLRAQGRLRIGRIARIEAHRDDHIRHGAALREDDGNAVRELTALDRRKVERRKRTDIRKLRAIDRRRKAHRRFRVRIEIVRGRMRRRLRVDPPAERAAVERALAGLHGQRIDRPRKPFLRRLLHDGRRERTELGETLFVVVRVVREQLALRQRHRLAAEAADGFHAADASRNRRDQRAAHFVRRRAVAQEFRDHLIQALCDLRGVDAGLHVGRHLENARVHELLQRRRDRDRDLLLAHQRVVEARTRQTAEDGGRHAKRRRILVVQASHHPAQINARRRDAVGHLVVLRRLQRRDRRVDCLHCGAARNVAEVLLDQRLGGCRVHVAREHEHGVIRAVVVAEPLSDVVEARRIKVGHRTDRRVVIGVPFREEVLELQILDEAIRLIVALALLVLDDAALVIEFLLRHRAEQMAHAVALEEERAFQRAGRHGLEIVRAVEPRRAVEVRGADLLQRFEIIARCVLRTVEHQMLEQVRKPGFALRFVLRTDAVPDRDGDDRRLTVRVNDHAQAVRQRELLVRNVDPFRQIRSRRRGGDGGKRRCNQRQTGKRNPEHGIPTSDKRRGPYQCARKIQPEIFVNGIRPRGERQSHDTYLRGKELTFVILYGS